MSQTNNIFKYQYKGEADVRFHKFLTIYGADKERLKVTKKQIDQWKSLVEETTRRMETALGGPKARKNKEQALNESVLSSGYRKITKNEKVEDVEKLVVPFLGDTADHDAVVMKLKKFYPVVEGYHSNKFEITNHCFYLIMKECLKVVNAGENQKLNADILYHALYLTFPLRGSPNVMAAIFPSLVMQFESDLDYLTLEPWKKEEAEEMTRKATSSESHFSLSLDFPSELYSCASTCFLNCDKEAIKLAENALYPSSRGQSILLYFSKDIDFSNDLNPSFWEELFSKGNNRINFCDIAKNHAEFGTCRDLFVMLFQTFPFSTAKTFKMPRCDEHRLSNFEKLREEVNQKWAAEMRNRFERGKRKARKNKAKIQKIFKECKNDWYEPLCEPCRHSGDCGPDVPNCSCKYWCTERCKCDINCPRRYPGCRCSPGQCGTTECLCVQLELECVPGLCQSCMDQEGDESVPKEHKCKNYVFHRDEECLVVDGPSSIAGTGAFLKEPVKKGQFIGEYVGQHISEREFSRRSALDFYRCSYHFGLPNLQGSIDAQYAGNETRFINHSDDPNVFTFYRLVDGEPRVGFAALKDLEMGTELTFDYDYSEESKKLFFETSAMDRIPQKGATPEPETTEEEDNEPSPSMKRVAERTTNNSKRAKLEVSDKEKAEKRTLRIRPNKN